MWPKEGWPGPRGPPHGMFFFHLGRVGIRLELGLSDTRELSPAEWLLEAQIRKTENKQKTGGERPVDHSQP